MSNNGGLATWSKTSASNAGADNTVNWAEGQAPSSVNDSGRAMMASAAKWRDDISGSILTTGSSAAYQVASNQSFINLTDFASQVIAFTPHVTNTAGPVTMTVDGFANLPLRSAPNVELPAGVLIQGTPYVALYNNTDHSLYLQSFYGASPYLIPLGGMIDFTGLTAPNSNFALPFGQAISRTTYASYFTMVGTTYGTGDGTTTFNIPDLRGRVVAGKDDMGGSVAGRLSGASITTGNAVTLGGSGGAETKTLTTANLPPYTPTGSVATTIITNGKTVESTGTNNVGVGGANTGGQLDPITASSTFTGTAQGGTSIPFAIVQPSIILNKILRII